MNTTTDRRIVSERLSRDRTSITFTFDDGSTKTLKRVAGGDRHPLAGQLERIDSDLKDLKTDHAAKYREYQAAEKEIGESETTVKQDDPLFVKFDEAGKAVDDLAGKMGGLEATRSGIIEAMKRAGHVVPGPESNESSDERDATMKAILEAIRGNGGPRKSAGERIADGDEYKALAESGVLSPGKRRVGDVAIGEAWTRDETKALITGAADSSAGAFVTPDRIGYYPLPMRPLTVLDLITVGNTNSDLVEFVKMLSFTNNAREVAEAISTAPIGDGTGGTATAVQGGLKPESGMTFEIIDTAVKTIAHWVPATKRALADAGQLATIIDGMLRFGLDDRLEGQIVAGDGSGENLRGILETTGTNSVPAGPGSIADKCHFGMTQCRLDQFEPTGVLLNPLDEETVRLSRTEEGGPGTGAYLFGSPNAQGPMTLWGKPVAISPTVPQGTAIVGAFRAAILWMREGTQVIASDSHMDFFTRNLVAILAELRAAFGIPTPQAFCEVDLATAP